MREPEGGLLSRLFIGRHDEREQIKTRLHQDGGILLLFGQPQVGKASLAVQVADELRTEHSREDGPGLCVYKVDCKECSDWPEILQAICRSFSLDDTFANENLLLGAILQRLRASGAEKLLLLFLGVNGLNPTGSDVQSMTRCLQSLAASDVMTLVTSRRQLKLPAVQRIHPLTLNDAVELLRQLAPEVTATEFVPLLQRYCHGLPPLVLQMAHYVSGDPMLAYSAAELKQALEEDGNLLMKGLSAEAKKLFATLSPEVKGHVSNLAHLLDGGSFSLETFQAVVGLEGTRVKSVLRTLYDEAPLIIDNDTQRMRLEPLVLHHVRQLGHVGADDQARLRVVTLLGRVLTRAERDLYVAGQDTVYGHLHGDWPQLQNVLRQAIHCTGDTYHAYLQVALQADKLLAKCFPHEALTFYKNMAAASVRFGTVRDQATLQGLIGMAVTVGQAGTGWEEALHHFGLALPVLQEDRRSVSYLRLLCDMGLTYHRLNRLHEADQYLRKAVDISKDTYVEDERELIFYLLRARSFLALPNIFRGHYAESKALLYETLEMCDQHAPHHPDKPVLINSLGLIYERSDEDQDLALKFYKQSLVERRRYAEVAPGDMVVTLNNVGMQYSRRGQYDTALEFLEEAAAIRAREDRWHYYTALTQQHIGQVAIQKGDYSKAERHLNEAACVYARCTPRHDVRCKVALAQAHLYVTEGLRDVGQTKRYLREVCRLVEPVQHDLSDNGLMVLSSAVQHTVQLEGWVPSHTVTSLLSWMQKLLLKYDGDRYKQLSEHQSIINDMLSAVTSGDVTEDQKEALTSRVTEQCQMCIALSVNENAPLLWRDSESKGEKLRTAISFLRESPAMKNVLKLSKQQQSIGEPEPGTTAREREDAVAQSLAMRQEGFPGLSPTLHTQLQNPQASTALCLSQLDQQHQEHKQGQSLTGSSGNNPDLHEPGEVAELFQERQLQDYQQVLRLLNLNQNVQGLESVEERPSRAGPGLPTTQHQHHNDELDLHHLESARLSSLGESRSHQYTSRAADHVTESDQYSSCSLTNSNPPSMSISDAASSLESSGSGVRRQQEEETFCQRMVLPLQETARDHRSQGFNLNVSAHPTSRSTHQEEEGEVGSVSSAMTASLRHAQERFSLGGSCHSSEGPGSDWVGLRTLERLHQAEQEKNTEASGGRGPLYTTEGDAHTPQGEDSLREEILQGRVRSYVESSWPENVVFCDTLQSGLQSVPTLPPTVSAPNTTSLPTQHAHELSFTTATTMTSASHLTSSSSSSSSSSQPPLTLQSVVTCAQQLMAVMSSDDVVTREQRRALEKLASLTDVSQLAGQSVGGGQGGAGLVQQTLLNLLPFQDQAAKLSFLEAQHTGPAPPLQHPSQTLHQSQPTTRTPSSVSSQSQTPTHYLPHHQHSGFVSLHQEPRDQTRSVHQSPSQPQASEPHSAAVEDQSAAHCKLALGTERESASRVERANERGGPEEPRPQGYGAQGLEAQTFEQQAGGPNQRDRPMVSQHFRQAHGLVTEAFEQQAGGPYERDRPGVSQHFQQAHGPPTQASGQQAGGFSQRHRPGLSQQATGFHDSPGPEPHGSSSQRNYPHRGTEPHFSTHPLQPSQQATETGLLASNQQTTELHVSHSGGPIVAGEGTQPHGVRVAELRHGIEPHGVRVAELRHGTEPHGVRVAEPPHRTELHGVAAPREATENDERSENPGHVCTSVHCQCSFTAFR